MTHEHQNNRCPDKMPHSVTMNEKCYDCGPKPPTITIVESSSYTREKSSDDVSDAGYDADDEMSDDKNETHRKPRAEAVGGSKTIDSLEEEYGYRFLGPLRVVNC
jgi:hypothetical protein